MQNGKGLTRAVGGGRRRFGAAAHPSCQRLGGRGGGSGRSLLRSNARKARWARASSVGVRPMAAGGRRQAAGGRRREAAVAAGGRRGRLQVLYSLSGKRIGAQMGCRGAGAAAASMAGVSDARTAASPLPAKAAPRAPLALLGLVKPVCCQQAAKWRPARSSRSWGLRALPWSRWDWRAAWAGGHAIGRGQGVQGAPPRRA